MLGVFNLISVLENHPHDKRNRAGNDPRGRQGRKKERIGLPISRKNLINTRLIPGYISALYPGHIFTEDYRIGLVPGIKLQYILAGDCKIPDKSGGFRH
jgi:hypothetical protein